MNTQTLYVLDSNVFIESAKRYYAFDIAPGFWTAMIFECAIGRLVSIDRVKIEIEKGKDALAQWVKTDFKCWEPTAVPDVVAAYQQIMIWAQDPALQFTAQAKADFASNADGWVVAYSKAKGATIVTQETYDASSKRRIKIPNACQAAQVQCCDQYQMMRALKITWN